MRYSGLRNVGKIYDDIYIYIIYVYLYVHINGSHMASRGLAGLLCSIDNEALIKLLCDCDTPAGFISRAY